MPLRKIRNLHKNVRKQALAIAMGGGYGKKAPVRNQRPAETPKKNSLKKGPGKKKNGKKGRKG